MNNKNLHNHNNKFKTKENSILSKMKDKKNNKKNKNQKTIKKKVRTKIVKK